MSSASVDHVFSVPFRHLWSTNFAGEQSVSVARPSGLARFVGDQPNFILKHLKFLANRSSDYALASAVFEDSHWPLVLFGASGTGKTSLALAVISELAEGSVSKLDAASEEAKPIFMSALDFDRRFRSALQTDSVIDFRRRLIRSSGLVIDDLHQLNNKPAAQREFILILDKMVEKNRPIVLTMCDSPLACSGLLPQLVSRLSGGLALPVHPPGPLARAEIIRDLATINRLTLTKDAIELLVDRLLVTVPKLDHFFAQIRTTLKSRNDDLTLPIDAAKLTSLFKKTDRDLDELSRQIIKSVASEFHLKPADLKSNSRKQTVMLARSVAIYLNRELLGNSFLKIGSYFGNRDHSTIIHAHRKIETILSDQDSHADASAIQATVQRLKQHLIELFAARINFV